MRIEFIMEPTRYAMESVKITLDGDADLVRQLASIIQEYIEKMGYELY